MSRPPMVLTGPQAFAIGAVALAAWSFRASLRAAGHVIRCGPSLLGFLDDEDFDEFIAEQRERFAKLAEGN